MSDAETTATYDPEHWVHRRTEVDSIAYDGTEHARRAIVDWVLAGGGAAQSRATGDLLVLGARGWLPVLPELDHVVRSIDVPGRGREFFPMGTDVLAVAYDRGENHGAVPTREQVTAMVLTADQTQNVETLRQRIHILAAGLEALR